MNDTDKPALEYDPEDEESAPVQYEVAVRLWTYQGSAAWARFSAMLLANSIVAVTVATMLTSGAMLCAVPFLPLAGIALCTIWLTIFERGAEYELYYIWKASQLEALLPGQSVKTVRDAHDFHKVTHRDGHLTGTRSIEWAVRVRMRKAGRAVIAIFFFIHGAMLLGSTLLALKTICSLLVALGASQCHLPWKG
jgi:hypothetical protein